MPRGAGNSRDPAKVRVFVAHYLRHFDGARAYRDSGIGVAKSAKQAAYELLRHPDVQAELQRQKERLIKRHDLSLDNVVEELRRVGFSRIDEIATWDGKDVAVKGSDEMDESAKSAVKELARDADGRIKIKMHEKVPALLALGKHLGMKERIEHTGADGAPLAAATVHYHFPGRGRMKPPAGGDAG